MSWISWLIALLAWLSIGLSVAYLFGRIVRGVEAPEKAGRLPSPAVLLYLRHARRAETSLRTRAAPHTRLGREAGS